MNLPGILSERFFKIVDENKDDYIDLAGIVGDSLKFDRLYTYDTLTGVFQKTTIGADVFNKLIVTNKSPYSRITGLEDVKIKEQPEYRRWAISLQAGVDVFSPHTPYLGAGLSWTIFRFKKK